MTIEGLFIFLYLSVVAALCLAFYWYMRVGQLKSQICDLEQLWQVYARSRDRYAALYQEAKKDWKPARRGDIADILREIEGSNES